MRKYHIVLKKNEVEIEFIVRVSCSIDSSGTHINHILIDKVHQDTPNAVSLSMDETIEIIKSKIKNLTL